MFYKKVVRKIKKKYILYSVTFFPWKSRRLRDNVRKNEAQPDGPQVTNSTTQASCDLHAE